MSRISLGVLCGLIFGGVDVALMIPLSFPDKRAAMLGAFIARFGLGFVICNIRLPWPGWAVGLFLGILLLDRQPIRPLNPGLDCRAASRPRAVCRLSFSGPTASARIENSDLPERINAPLHSLGNTTI